MFFRTLFATAACILMTAAIAAAQSPEIFVGYSNLQSEGLPDRNDPNWPFNTDFFSNRSTLHGVNASVSGYWAGIGLTGDFSWGRQGNINAFTGGQDDRHTDTLYLLGGPAIKFSQKTKAQPFVRVMAGAAHTSFKVSRQFTGSGGTVTNSFDVGSTDFSASAGGGLDIRLGERTKLRVIQVDYAPVFLRDRTVQVLGNNGVIQPSTLDGQRQDNFRFSFGVTF